MSLAMLFWYSNLSHAAQNNLLSIICLIYKQYWESVEPNVIRLSTSKNIQISSLMPFFWNAHYLTDKDYKMHSLVCSLLSSFWCKAKYVVVLNKNHQVEMKITPMTARLNRRLVGELVFQKTWPNALPQVCRCLVDTCNKEFVLRIIYRFCLFKW